MPHSPFWAKVLNVCSAKWCAWMSLSGEDGMQAATKPCRNKAWKITCMLAKDASGSKSVAEKQNTINKKSRAGSTCVSGNTRRLLTLSLFLTACQVLWGSSLHKWFLMPCLGQWRSEHFPSGCQSFCLFALVTVLAQTLFALVRRHCMSFLFLSVRHSGEYYLCVT